MRPPSAIAGDGIMDSEPEGQARYRAGASRPVVIGDHDLVVRTEGGSDVTVRAGEPPRVSRRVPPDAGSPRPRPLGRERELAAIVQALDDGLAVLVHGADGSGRSTVLRYLAQARGGDKDVVFLSARGLTTDDLLQTLFDACFDSDGYRPEPPRMRELMSAVRALLLVDDFDGAAEDLPALLDAAPGCEIVVASRERGSWSGGFAQELGGLAEADGIALLARELGRNLEAHEQADAVELWRVAGGNPLALVQVAAAVRKGTGTNGAGTNGAGTLAEFRDSQQVAQTLARDLTEPQRQVLGILYLVGTVSAPIALLTALVGPPCEAAVERLVATGLVTEGSPRIAGQMAEHVAVLAAATVAPARLAEAITAWLAAGKPDRRLLGESAPLILQVLRATMAAGGYRTAVLLARAASPGLAMALRLGAWGTLLELGLSAARAVNAADDEAFFAHEAAARLRRVGHAAAPEAFAGMAAPLPTQLISPPRMADVETTMEVGVPPAPILQSAAGPRHRNIRTLVTKPVVWLAVIAAAIAGTIAFTAINGTSAFTAISADSSRPAAPVGYPPIESATSTPPITSEETTSPEPTTLTTTSVPTVTSTATSKSTTTPTAAATSATTSEHATPSPPSKCVSFLGTLDLGSVAVDGSSTAEHSFYAPACHPYGLNTGNVSLQGDSYAFSLSLASCPEITMSGGNALCTITITFHPYSPGDFSAQIYIPEAGPADQQRGYGSISLRGHADIAIADGATHLS
jgi:hypothetical protein